MITMQNLRDKCKEVSDHTGMNLAINHLYWRSAAPYTLTYSRNPDHSTTLARGTKADLYNYLSAMQYGFRVGYDQGYRTSESEII